MSVSPFLLDLMKLWPLFMLVSALVFGGSRLYLATKFVSHERCHEHRCAIQKFQDAMQKNIEKEEERLRADEKELEKRITNLGSEVAILKQRVECLPSGSDVQEIKVKLESIRGTQGTLEATLKGDRELMKRVEYQLNIVDAYLRERS